MSESEDIQLLIDAKEQARQKVAQDPSAANLSAFDKAKKLLDEAQAEKDAEPCFDNRLKVLPYLEEAGYKIKKSKLYADCKKGLLKVEDDGTILQSSVDRYIAHPKSGLAAYRQMVDAGELEESEGLSKEKAKGEIARLEWINKKLQLEYEKEQGKWLPRDSFEQELAARMAVLEIGLKHEIRTHAAEWIALVAGNLDKVGELTQEIHLAVDRRLTEYASLDTFQVMFVEDE